MDDLKQLIEDYELAYARLTHVIADETLQVKELHAADRELDRSFVALVDANFISSELTIAHVEYLLNMIKALHPDDSVLATLVDRIKHFVKHQ